MMRDSPNWGSGQTTLRGQFKKNMDFYDHSRWTFLDLYKLIGLVTKEEKIL